MADKYEAQMKRLKSARIKMVSASPFFGDLAFKLPISFDDRLDPPTAATNGKEIIFHPDLVDKLPIDELVFVFAHEVVHCMLMHILRRGKRDPEKWNIACDVVDNYLLQTNSVGAMPDWCINEPGIYHKGNGQVEAIYDLLPKNKKYKRVDTCMDASDEDADEIATTWRGYIEQAKATAKAAGNMPGNLEKFIDQITTPKVKWQDRFRSFAMTVRGVDRTYTKPNRRYSGMDIIMPGNLPDERMGQMVFAIDCSGSTDDVMIGQCGGEMGAIQEELRPDLIHALYFDTDVKKHEEYEADEPITVKAYGRGGTCFRKIFEYIANNGIEPECVIVATDLQCHDFGPPPPYPVLWCVLQGNKTDAPWGEVLVVD